MCRQGDSLAGLLFHCQFNCLNIEVGTFAQFLSLYFDFKRLFRNLQQAKSLSWPQSRVIHWHLFSLQMCLPQLRWGDLLKLPAESQTRTDSERPPSNPDTRTSGGKSGHQGHLHMHGRGVSESR